MINIKAKLLIINLLIILLSTGCGVTPPPLEFAPQPPVIEKAIALTLDNQYNYLSDKLQTKPLKFEITKIKINKIEPTLILNLPTYHLKGTYQIKLTLNKTKNKIVINKFEIDLQRGKKGQTWRLIVPYKDNKQNKYFSYQLR